MDMTPDQFAKFVKDDRLTQVLCALIAKRVTAASVMSGSTKASAAAIVADAKLVMAELAK